jgi:hypothetical protein
MVVNTFHGFAVGEGVQETKPSSKVLFLFQLSGHHAHLPLGLSKNPGLHLWVAAQSTVSAVSKEGCDMHCKADLPIKQEESTKRNIPQPSLLGGAFHYKTLQFIINDEKFDHV